MVRIILFPSMFWVPCLKKKKISSIGQSQIQKKTRRIRNVNSESRPEKYTTVFLSGLIKRYLALNHFVPIQQGKTCTLAD